ncbi:MAG: hypothetical protein ACR2GY_03235 [Phycisphaerales bacterium]
MTNLYDEENETKASWWAGGFLAELFAAHPILTIFLIIGFCGGAFVGATQGLTAGGLLWLALGALIGAAGGIVAILILWLVLILIGFAG